MQYLNNIIGVSKLQKAHQFCPKIKSDIKKIVVASVSNVNLFYVLQRS